MNSFLRRILFLLLFSLAVNPLAALDMSSGQGVSLSQVSYPGVSGGTNTAIGMIEVDLNLLRKTTSMTSGYLNMATSAGWVVRNLPVLAEAAYPYSRLSTGFDLGVTAGTAVSQLTVALQYSDSVATSFSAAPATVFAVAARQISKGGAGVGAGGPLTPPTLNDVLFGNPADNDTITQFDHPNIEAADSQCMPMSVANSLQYLKDTQGLQLPHEHKMGLKGDNTLVGQLDTAMARSVTDRRHGSGTWGLQGKLSYIAANKLNERVSTTHWGVGGPDSGGANVSSSSGGVTATSAGKGANVNFDQVLQALKEGQDCEMVITYGSGGAHAVDIVGAGKFKGQPWLIHASDVNQASDSEGAGPAGLEFEYLTGPDASGQYKFSGRNDVLTQVICEKYVPPPATEKITSVTDPKGHSCCVTAPPETVSLAVSGSTMTVTGSASWLPLSGTIVADGSFSLTGSGTVAGFSNVTSSFVGTSSGGVYTGTITVGTKGELYGTPISWGVTITATPSGVTPAIRVNGFRHEHAAVSSDLLRVSLTMKAGMQKGQQGDWWLVTATPAGLTYFDLASLSWKNGIAATYTGALGDIDFFALPYMNLPAGTYDLYFGFDSVPDGALSTPSLVYDVVRVTVN